MAIYKFKIRLLKDHRLPLEDRLRTEEENLHPRALIYKDGQRQLIILGSPIYRNKIDSKAISKRLFETGINKSLIRELNGSFLLMLYDEKNFTLTIINDRFASIPFYYFVNKIGFLGSINYADMWDELVERKELTINKEAFYEFIHFQRLLGNKTYDAKTRYLNSASILFFDANRDILKRDRYWRPNFKKEYRPAGETSRMLAELVSNSISQHTSDGKRYGLLLSGGLDSRLVLAGLKKSVECVTISSYKNNEYFVAKELADAKGYHHNFIKRPSSHYGDILEEALSLGGAMNMYAHAHFLGLDKQLKTKADVFLHGHGFDYMFQGKYLPYTSFEAFNKKTYMKTLMNIDDIKNKFISKISYRLKSIDPLSLVINKEKIREYLYSSINEVLEEAKDCCNNEYDLWEYLIMHNLSRHYTFLNISSIRTIAEERTIAFDNQLFDFYLSLPIESRLNKNIFANAIRLLNERLYKIRNANTNFNIYDSDFVLTAKLSANKILSKFGIKVMLPPGQKERSWPARRDIISENSKIKEATKNLANSSVLEELSFLDMDKVKFFVEGHLDGKRDYSDLILTLITIDTFMKKSHKTMQRIAYV